MYLASGEPGELDRRGSPRLLAACFDIEQRQPNLWRIWKLQHPLSRFWTVQDYIFQIYEDFYKVPRL
jgi:hypothetical protein